MRGEQRAERVQAALAAVRHFVGKDGRVFRNEAGDLVVLSRDGLREIRFDFNSPAPHQHPHMHVIEYEWVKNSKDEIINERIWPSDVPNS